MMIIIIYLNDVQESQHGKTIFSTQVSTHISFFYKYITHLKHKPYSNNL